MRCVYFPIVNEVSMDTALQEPARQASEFLLEFSNANITDEFVYAFNKSSGIM